MGSLSLLRKCVWRGRQLFSLMMVVSASVHVHNSGKWCWFRKAHMQTSLLYNPIDILFYSDPKSATIRTLKKDSSTGCESSYKGSGKKGINGFEGKSGVEQKRGDEGGSNTVPDLDERYLNIRGTSHSEKGDAEGITDLNEPVMNITGSNESHLGRTTNFVEEEVHVEIKQQLQECKEEAQQGVEGASHLQRKRLKLDLDAYTSKKNKQLSEAENILDLTLQSGETNESKVLKNSHGRSWIQKASWKSLVGETGRMSFTLGSMLDQDFIFLPSGDLKSSSGKLGQPSGFEKPSNNLRSESSVPSSSLSGETTLMSRLGHSKKALKLMNGLDISKNSE